ASRETTGQQTVPLRQPTLAASASPWGNSEGCEPPDFPGQFGGNPALLPALCCETADVPGAQVETVLVRHPLLPFPGLGVAGGVTRLMPAGEAGSVLPADFLVQVVED